MTAARFDPTFHHPEPSAAPVGPPATNETHPLQNEYGHFEATTSAALVAPPAVCEHIDHFIGLDGVTRGVSVAGAPERDACAAAVALDPAAKVLWPLVWGAEPGWDKSSDRMRTTCREWAALVLAAGGADGVEHREHWYVWADGSTFHGCTHSASQAWPCPLAGGADGEALPEPPPYTHMTGFTEEDCPVCDYGVTGAEHVAGCAAADAGAPDDEALIEALRAMAPHVGPPNQAWNASQTCYRAADRLAALNATVTRRDTSIAAFKSDLAAVRAELAQAQAVAHGPRAERDAFQAHTGCNCPAGMRYHAMNCAVLPSFDRRPSTDGAPDDEALIERLRHEAGRYEYGTNYNAGPSILTAAADRLAAVRAELASWHATHATIPTPSEWNALVAERDALAARIAAVRALVDEDDVTIREILETTPPYPDYIGNVERAIAGAIASALESSTGTETADER